MTTLLVASGGGHLEQLNHLLPRLRLRDDLLWVTYDTSQARSLLSEQQVVTAHHPTTKNLANAIRNAALARRLFTRRTIDRVVSTGAAVAVPFITVARRRGVPCHYIESATRVTGPSLSGRMLQLLPSVHLYRQSGSWGEPRWLPGPSSFDGFRTTQARPHDVRRILVSLGTHNFPFRRAVEQLARLLKNRNVQIVWQLGNTPPPAGLHGRVESQVDVPEFAALIENWADVVVGHAGTGFSLTALSHGKVPVLIPRRRQHREHTDDHQSEIANDLGGRGLAVVSDASTLRWAHLEQASRLVVGRATPPPFSLKE